MEVQEGLNIKKSGHCLAHAYALAQGLKLSFLGLFMTPAQCCYACAKSAKMGMCPGYSPFF